PRAGRKPPAPGLGWRLRRAWWKCTGGSSGWRARSAEAVPSPLPCRSSHQGVWRGRPRHEAHMCPHVLVATAVSYEADTEREGRHMHAFGETILLVDDDLDFQEIVTDRLAALGYRVLAASNGHEGLALLEHEGPQIVLLDIEMPDMNGLEVLQAMRTRAPDVTVVMLTAYGTIERAVEAMRHGAYDFLPKPFEPAHLVLTVQKALERERLKRDVAILSEAVSERYRQVVGQSATMQHALDMAKKVASSNATVLLLGESGTGKELFARAIHDWSDRRTKPFLAINCVALATDLLESELFGHEKGAFTGAHQLKKGKLELAQGGTVFRDEVGDLAPALQAKLLRLLQEREFERVGGTTVIQVDARVIAATNRDLSEAIRAGRFREDLYYRLNVVAIPLPPLRERKDDIPAL